MEPDFSWNAGSRIQPIATQCQIQNLRVRVASAPTAGKSYTFTIQKNGSDTSLSVTISDAATSGTDSSHKIRYDPGDTFAIKRTTSGTPTLSTNYISFDVDNAVTGESTYGCSSNALSGGARNRVFSPDTWASSVGTNRYDLVAAAGTLTDVRIVLDVAPGVGSSRTFNIYKNGTIQDGSGGSVNTTLTISDNATSGTVSFSLSLSAGDQVYIEHASSGSPASAVASLATKFVATTDHYSQLASGSPQLSSTGALDLFLRPTNSAASFNATEGNMDVDGGLSTFTVRNLQVRSTLSVTNCNFTLRKGGSDQALTCNITGGTTGSDNSNSVSVSAGDLFDWRLNGTLGGNRVVAISAIQEAASQFPGGGGAKGGKRGGGGGINLIPTGGTVLLNYGNTGIDIGVNN